jgi:hypothetical protein
MKSTFLSDSQPPLSCAGGLQTAVSYIIGRKGAVAAAVRVHPSTSGFKEGLEGEYDLLAKDLRSTRAKSQADAAKRKLSSGAKRASASLSSESAFSSMQSNPSASVSRKKARRTAGLDGFVHKGTPIETLHMHSDKVRARPGQVFPRLQHPRHYCSPPPLLYGFCKSLVGTGAAHCTFPPPMSTSTNPDKHTRLHTGHQIGHSVLADHSKLYHERVAGKGDDLSACTKRYGYTATADGTTL